VSTAFEISNAYVDDLARLFPTIATSLGIDGRHDEWGPFGLDGVEAATDLETSYRERLAKHLSADDPQQRLAARIAMDGIDESLQRVGEGDHLYDLRHMASTFQSFRSIFNVMPKESGADWENIARRLETLDQPMTSYRGLLDHARQKGKTVARRQVESVVEQARNLAGEDSSYLRLLEEAGKMRTERLESVVDHARSTYEEFADWLSDAYLPSAADRDGVEEDRYRRAANRLVGLEVNPFEAYEWGWSEFERLLLEMEKVAGSILPGSGFAQMKQFLETDPEGTVDSGEELVSFVTRVLGEAVDDLAGKHFDVPDEIRPITVQIAPPGGPLGVSYVRPSEDLKRPGGVWYTVGDQSVFPLYQHRSTAYHEGFPGHHLQIATQMLQHRRLSRVQRVLTWYPGFSEGWAMYAEVLMGELGYLDDSRSHFGMLAKQMYRAVRIVVDIGLHLGLSIPLHSPVAPGEPWTYEVAVRFMEVYGFRTPAQAKAEVLRYLGWPGQAISYKLGEREILSIREETSRRLGVRFDTREFHSVVLEGGQMRLDLLRNVVRGRLP
jgi:uncharacterized protein (DUF885 family)